jgi:hypothetical protein
MARNINKYNIFHIFKIIPDSGLDILSEKSDFCCSESENSYF